MTESKATKAAKIWGTYESLRARDMNNRILGEMFDQGLDEEKVLRQRARLEARVATRLRRLPGGSGGSTSERIPNGRLEELP